MTYHSKGNKPSKANRQKRYQMTAKELFRLKREGIKEGVERGCLIMLGAVADELNLTEEQLINVADRTILYANALDDHLIQLKQIQATIEDHTGVKLKGF